MSSLTSFFQKRHKKAKVNSNQQLTNIFNQPLNAPIQPKQNLQKKQKIQTEQMIDKEHKLTKNNDTEIDQNKKEKKKLKKMRQKLKKQQAAKQEQLKESQNLDATIFVGNVSLEASHAQVKKYFETYGKVDKVWFRSIPVQQSKLPKKASHILKKYQQGADTKHAYIRFESKDNASKACSCNGSVFMERNIRVSLCDDKQIDYQSTIFIGNLPHQVKDQMLWDAFKNIGTIQNVRVIRKKDTFQGMGIAYIRFGNPEEMKKAIKQMNGKKIGDRQMRIKKAVTKDRIEKKLKNVIKKKFKKGRTPSSKNNMLYDVKGKKMKNMNTKDVGQSRKIWQKGVSDFKKRPKPQNKASEFKNKSEDSKNKPVNFKTKPINKHNTVTKTNNLVKKPQKKILS